MEIYTRSLPILPSFREASCRRFQTAHQSYHPKAAARLVEQRQTPLPTEGWLGPDERALRRVQKRLEQLRIGESITALRVVFHSASSPTQEN